MSADFWLGLQQDWDLRHAMRSESADEIARLEPLGKRADAADRDYGRRGSWPGSTYSMANGRAEWICITAGSSVQA
jgi:hypothetical protein